MNPTDLPTAWVLCDPNGAHVYDRRDDAERDSVGFWLDDWNINCSHDPRPEWLNKLIAAAAAAGYRVIECRLMPIADEAAP